MDQAGENDPVQQPKKGMSKRVKRIILLSVVSVVALVGIVFAVMIIFMPSKQEYKDVGDSADALRESYTQYTGGMDRDMLGLSAQANRLQQALSAIEDRVALEQETEPVLLVDEARLEAIEQQERERAEVVARNERSVDELVANLNDRGVRRAYESYKEVRQRLYGEGRTIEQFTESAQRTYRVIYSCQALVQQQFVDTIEDARAIVSYGKGCQSLVAELRDEPFLADIHRDIVDGMNKVIAERVELLEEMVDADEFDYEAYDALYESQEDMSLLAFDRRAIIPIHEISGEPFSEFRGLVHRKQQRAFGSVRDF